MSRRQTNQALDVHLLDMHQGYQPGGAGIQVVGAAPGTTIIVGGTHIGVGAHGTSVVHTGDKRWRQQTTIPVETRAGCCGLLMACTVISVCNSIVAYMISGESALFSFFFKQMGIADKVSRSITDWGVHEQQIQDSFTCIRILSVLLAAIVLVRFEYRLVCIIAASVMGLSVLVASFLSTSLIAIIGILVGGVASIASGFLYMCSILPILEHFEDGIFRALHAVHQGETIGYVICALMRLGTNNSWRALFRYQVIVMGVAIGASFALTPAEFHDSSVIIRGVDGPAKTKRKYTWHIFKHPAIYLLMVGFFFQRLGFTYLEEQAGALGTMGMSYLILYYVAQWLGPILLFWKQCVAKYYPQVILVAFSLAVGAYTIAMPQVDDTDSLLLVFIIVIGVGIATAESFRGVILTAQFLKEQYCITYGILYTCAGLGEIIATFTEKKSDNFIYTKDKLDVFALNLSGSVIIVSAFFVCLAAVAFARLGFPRGAWSFPWAWCSDFGLKFTRLREDDSHQERIVDEEVAPDTAGSDELDIVPSEETDRPI